MDSVHYFTKAWVIGIAIAAIVGPIGMLFIRKTLEVGISGAIAVGLGATFADGIYGAIAALGLSAISHFLLEQSLYLKLGGGLFLLYLSYQDLKSDLDPKAAKTKNKKPFGLGVEVFFLTLANPITIASFLAIFAGISVGPTSLMESLVIALGVLIGSLSWWIILGGILLKIRHKISQEWLHRIKYVSALILGTFGILAIVSGGLTLINAINPPS
ncbi:MAG: LysE family translocator [Alphaproteobacteria bacterium]|nr:LysE family translocator [Alphaproteobacteria bacterium]